MIKEKNMLSNKMIYGIQKLSVVDYPGEPSFVIFLGGCNYRCPYCHNKGIVEKEFTSYDVDSVLKLIEARIGFINAVVVTGGEPTLYGDDLIELLSRIKGLKLKIKLDTNGTIPSVIEEIIKEKLVDYIAMDLKNTYAKYEMTTGVKVVIQNIKKSIILIEDSGIPYEFRTTVNKEMHTVSDIEEMTSYLRQKDHYFLQPYQYSEFQIKDIHYTPYTKEELDDIKQRLEIHAKTT